MSGSSLIITKACSLTFGTFLFVFSAALSCSVEMSGSSENVVTRPGFDCKKASTEIETTICSNNHLSKLDYSLSRIYKKAKKNNVNIKSAQREWHTKRNKCKGDEIVSCLEMLYLQRINDLTLVDNSDYMTALPDGWKDFTHSEWISVSGLSSRCSVSENVKHLRFINFIKINNENELLTVACELGAYQDSHLMYRLSVDTIPVMAKEIIVNELYFDNGWKQKAADKITGYISLKDNEFTITRRYVGSWECGYVAKYNLDDLLKNEVLYPVSAKADNDCDNGIRRDEWPVVNIIK